MGTFGFGVSKTSGQYKMVMIYCVYTRTEESFRDCKFECQVYTLGTGSWRSISPGALLVYGFTEGVFLDGNFHWLACDLNKYVWISIFDFETELFSTCSSPGLKGALDQKTLSALRGCLCLCENSAEDKIVIWLLKDGTDRKYWTNEFNISRRSRYFYGVLYPIKVFGDGDVLIAQDSCSGLLCYSRKTRTIERTALIERYVDGRSMSAVSYTPSFLRLKTFFTSSMSAVGYTPSFLRLKTFFPTQNVSSF